ncbi:MAG: ribosomal protein S18-alanine N-acetyltransferase [Pseudomonadales bacterium]|jgi:ribosomal-protein-alanine N-acetyltransferase|nr:ribosomal protein S18-alanine N-acetyltransferase [Pseudomonadales bacterium]
MRREDLNAVVRNELRSYAFPWSPGNFADCLAAGDECWVAMHEQDIVGHGVLTFGAGEAHLLNLCITRASQGQGWGRALLAWMLTRARLRQADVVFLEARYSNTVAKKLYQSVGFRQIGIRRGYYPASRGREDARIMALDLE